MLWAILILSFDEFFITFQGTHDFQNITVNSSSPGVITVAGDFISGSLTNVILVIIYSENLGDVHVHYMFSSQSVEEVNMTKLNVRGLPRGLFNVSVFVVEDNGLPFNRSVTTPKSVPILDGNSGKKLLALS